MSNLFNRLTKTDTLYNSWKEIKQKNKGGGIDGVSIEEYDSDVFTKIVALSKALKEGEWKPQPYLKIIIPKNEKETRELGIMSIGDKIVQNAIKTIIEPILESKFLASSYGYRPAKGTIRCIRRVANEVAPKNRTHIIKFDIDNYFDTIDRDILFGMVKTSIDDFEICRLIELVIKMGVVLKNGKWTNTSKGVPQGAILSPLLSNLYLNELDRYFKKQNIISVRYADDFVAICESEESAIQTETIITEFINTTLKLNLNKSIIKTTEEGVEFLGLIIQKRNTFLLSESKCEQIVAKINAISIVKGEIAPQYIQSLSGIRNYYGLILSDELKNQWDNLLIARLEKILTELKICNEKRVYKYIKPISLFLQDNEIKKRSIAKNIAQRIKAELKIEVPLKTDNTNEKLIQSRKLEYRKRENEGAELVISTFGCSIGIQGGMVVVRNKGKIIQKLGANLKHITVLTDGVSFSSNLIKYCSDRNIPIDLFDNAFKHKSTILSEKFMRANNWSSQSQLSDSKSLELGKRIMIGKVKNQLNLIKYFHKYHKEDKTLQENYVTIECNISNILTKIKKLSLVPNQPYQPSLQALEAQAALQYWEYIRLLISDDEIDFKSREHKGAGDLMNSLLNYGYALIYPRVWQAILANKLNPYFGFVHYQEGKPILVYDIVELFRAQAVERVVISLIQRGEPLEMQGNLLSDKTRRLLMQNIFERLNRYEKYRGTEMRFEDIIKKQVAEIVQYIVEGKTYRPYIAKW